MDGSIQLGRRKSGQPGTEPRRQQNPHELRTVHGSNTRTFTPSLINEARFGYTRFFNSIGTFLAFNTDVVSGLGIPGFSGGPPVTWGIPNISFFSQGYSAIGDSTDGPYANDNNNLQFVDNLSWIHGKHTFRVGAEFMRQNYNQVGNQFSRGQFSFQANATQSPEFTGGDAFADFLLGTCTSRK